MIYLWFFLFVVTGLFSIAFLVPIFVPRVNARAVVNLAQCFISATFATAAFFFLNLAFHIL